MRKAWCWISLKPLLEKAYFTSKEARYLGVTSSVLNYYVKTGILRRISRGVYQYVHCKNASFRWQDLIEAVTAVPGGVICLISALAIYDLTEEIPRQHWIAISNYTSVKKNPDIKIKRFRNMELGISKIDLEGISVPIFDRERTIIDSFRCLSQETAIKALKMALSQKGVKKINMRKLHEYAKRLRVNISIYILALTT